MTRVLITNAYSARNRGDAAIVLGMVRSLRRTEAFRDATFRVSSADGSAAGAHDPVPTVGSFQSLARSFSRRSVVGSLLFLSVLLPSSVLWATVWRVTRLDLPVIRPLRELMREYAAADLVVAAGGGYLYTTSARRGTVVLLTNLHCFAVAALLGKPVALYAQSIGPFAGWWQAWLVRRALARVILVEVREGISRRLLESWRLATPIASASDGAFLLESRPADPGLDLAPSGSGPVVGMTVRRWFRDRRRQSEYQACVTSFVRWLVRERDASVVFLPQVTFTEGGDDDRVVARRIASAAAVGGRVRVVERELRADEIKDLCGRMDLFVGTRMHSNIFALSSGVPTVAIAYQPKTAGIMSELGLGRWVVPIDGISLAELQRTFDGIAERRHHIQRRLEAAIPRLEAGALVAGELIAEAYTGWLAARQRSADSG